MSLAFSSPMSPDLFDDLYKMLENIKIQVKRGNSNRRGFPVHQAVVFGITRQRYTGKIGDSRYTELYPDIWKEIQRVGNAINPEFKYNSVYVNRNVITPPHKDSKNVGKSLLVSFGEYTGCNIVIEGEMFDAKYNPVVFDGAACLHWNTNDLVGTKYSLVFFNTALKRAGNSQN